MDDEHSASPLSDAPGVLPLEVVEFVRAHITSLLQLEALLLVFESGERPRSANDVAREMYVPASAITGWLDEFVEAGLCCRDLDGAYRVVGTAQAYDLLARVAESYVRRPISLGRLVFGTTPTSARTTLAEAFRFRRDR